MILFIKDPSLINIIRDKYRKEVMVYNFTSMYSGYETLVLAYVNDLADPGRPINTFIDNIEFDLKYSDKMINNPRYFIDMMRIIVPAYQGINTILLVHRDPYRDSLMEALIKFFSVRYGYRSYIVDDVEDLDVINEPNFTPYGLIQLDADFNVYEELRMSGRAPAIIPEISIE